MNQKRTATSSFLLLGIVLIGLSFFAAGCEVGDFTSDETSDLGAISLAELNGQVQSPAPQPAAPSESDDDDQSQTAETDSTPAPAPAPSGDVFVWDPRADSVRVVIPASLPHWKFWVFSRRKHATLYGPDQRAANRAVTVEYILQGNGAYWRQQSLNAGDDGTVLIVINTKDLQANGQRNAGWRIMRPEQAQSGDGDRLVPGGPSN